MADRTCERCDKVFKYPKYLREHQARKTPCTPILEKEDLPEAVLEDPDLDQKKCRFCGRVFSSYTAMRRHVRNNCRIAPCRFCKQVVSYDLRHHKERVCTAARLKQGDTVTYYCSKGETVFVPEAEIRIPASNKYCLISIHWEEALSAPASPCRIFVDPCMSSWRDDGTNLVSISKKALKTSGDYDQENPFEVEVVGIRPSHCLKLREPAPCEITVEIRIEDETAVSVP